MTEPSPDETDETAGDTGERTPPESRWDRIERRMRHIYRTRVRTTTVVLVIVWLALLAFYGFSTQHYHPERDQQVRPVQTQQEPSSTVPTTTVETSTSVAPSSTEEPTSTSGTGSRESAGPTDHPSTGQQQDAPETASPTSELSTQTPGSTGR